MYWGKALPPDQLQQALTNSLPLGLYKATPPSKPPKSEGSPESPRTPSPTLEAEQDEDLEQIGLARLITDRVTFAYLTDVYIRPEYRGTGLGKWLVKCCKEVVDDMPAIRRWVLVTSLAKSKAFYERELGMWDSREEEGFIVMTKKAGHSG